MQRLIVNPLTKQGLVVNDCGTGSGGFKAGNKCAKGGVSSEPRDKYNIASSVATAGLDGFTGVLPAKQQKEVFGRNVFGKKRITIDASGQGRVYGSFKVAYGTDFVSFEKSFSDIAQLSNNPDSILSF